MRLSTLTRHHSFRHLAAFLLVSTVVRPAVDKTIRAADDPDVVEAPEWFPGQAASQPASLPEPHVVATAVVTS